MSPHPRTRYRGRFAPSPTGPLHRGSLVAALGSWLDARAAGGEWLLRIEDLDPPRCAAGAESAILHALEACGLEWDGEVVRQSNRAEAYAAALAELAGSGAIYPCTCSRRRIEALANRRARDGAWIYPGCCRARAEAVPKAGSALRLRVGTEVVTFHDRGFGSISEDLAQDVGDFVLRRADGLVAYQLAVVVDDAWQGITDVVRGSDLLESTPRQIFLQGCLGVPTPRYLHLPVVTDADGVKLSKQSRAPALQAGDAAEDLFFALTHLGLEPPAELRGAPPARQLDWARLAWPRRWP